MADWGRNMYCFKEFKELYKWQVLKTFTPHKDGNKWKLTGRFTSLQHFAVDCMRSYRVGQFKLCSCLGNWPLFWKKLCICVSEVSANCFADRGCHVISVTNPYGHIPGFVDRSRYYFFQVAPQLHSRGWADPVPDPIFFLFFVVHGNRTRDLRICSQELWPLDHIGGLWLLMVSYKLNLAFEMY
jgi:hypothetical protein